jgi:hypothetical protein
MISNPSTFNPQPFPAGDTQKNHVTISCRRPPARRLLPKTLKNRRFDPLNRVQNKIKKKLTGDTVFAIVMPHTVNADNKQ